jgi:hypothetical protein
VIDSVTEVSASHYEIAHSEERRIERPVGMARLKAGLKTLWYEHPTNWLEILLGFIMLGWALMYLYQRANMPSEFYRETTRYVSAGGSMAILGVTGTVKIAAAVLNLEILRRVISFVGMWIWFYMLAIIWQMSTVNAGRYIALVYALASIVVIIKPQSRRRGDA